MKQVIKYSLLAIAAACFPAHAQIMDIDPSAIAARIKESLEKTKDHEKELAAKEAEAETKAQNTEAKADSIANGAANIVVRTNEARAELSRLEQEERAQPAKEVCGVARYSFVADEALCGENSVITYLSAQASKLSPWTYRTEDARQTAEKNNPQIAGIVRQNYNIGEYRLAGYPTPTLTGKSPQALATEAFAKELDQHIQNLDWHSQAGRDGEVSRADLTHFTETSPKTLSESEMSITMSKLFIEHPPLPSSGGASAHSDREMLKSLSRNLLHNRFTSVYSKHLAMKSPAADGLPSSYEALYTAATARLQEAGTIDSPDGQNFMQRMATDTPGVGTMKREKILIAMDDLNLNVHKLKQSLALEQLLAAYGSALLAQNK